MTEPETFGPDLAGRSFTASALRPPAPTRVDGRSRIAGRWCSFGGVASLLALVLLVTTSGCRGERSANGTLRLMNVSYDPTRELFAELNPMFVAEWERETGGTVVIDMSHGGAGRQARAVIDGLPADVVTLATAPDIDGIATHSGRVRADWAAQLPLNSTPYTSTIVFVVRAGNPRGIRDWSDLVRDDISVITPNPKTSGGARWNFLAAYGYALRASDGDVALAESYMRELFSRVPVLDTGARASTTTFAQNGIGDVLLTWENEAWLLFADVGAGRFEIVVPSLSVRAEPPVAIVDVNVDRRGTRAVAEAYLRYLFTPAAQEVIARHHYRPTDPAVAAAHRDDFPEVEMLTIADFGGWAQAIETHFAEGALFDRVTARR